MSVNAAIKWNCCRLAYVTCKCNQENGPLEKCSYRGNALVASSYNRVSDILFFFFFCLCVGWHTCKYMNAHTPHWLCDVPSPPNVTQELHLAQQPRWGLWDVKFSDSVSFACRLADKHRWAYIPVTTEIEIRGGKSKRKLQINGMLQTACSSAKGFLCQCLWDRGCHLVQYLLIFWDR